MTKEKKAPHRPPIDFNWPVFDALVQFKVTKIFCAEYLGISINTIDRHLRKKFDCTFTEYNQKKMQRTGYKLQQKAIEMALDGNTTMMIFALKNLAGWSDKIETEATGAIEIKLPDAKLAKL